MEIWKDVKGYEGYYQVSNLGSIRGVDRLIKHSRWGKEFRKSRILSVKGIAGSGYPYVTLCKDSYRNGAAVHRIVAKAFIPNPENKPCINHINCVKTDNRAINLEWCTCKENMTHAYKNGLVNPTRGESCHDAKLNKFQVRVIRKCPDLIQKELAEIFNVSRSNISCIRRRKSWTHIN